MSDDDVTGRDLRTMWRMGSLVAIGLFAVGGVVVAGIVREVRQDTRIEAVEKWQADREAEERATKRMERWRRADPLKPTVFQLEIPEHGTVFVFTEEELGQLNSLLGNLRRDRDYWKHKAEEPKVCI